MNVGSKEEVALMGLPKFKFKFINIILMFGSIIHMFIFLFLIPIGSLQGLCNLLLLTITMCEC
jgi:hypothetical protein